MGFKNTKNMTIIEKKPPQDEVKPKSTETKLVISPEQKTELIEINENYPEYAQQYQNFLKNQPDKPFLAHKYYQLVKMIGEDGNIPEGLFNREMLQSAWETMQDAFSSKLKPEEQKEMDDLTDKGYANLDENGKLKFIEYLCTSEGMSQEHAIETASKYFTPTKDRKESDTTILEGRNGLDVFPIEFPYTIEQEKNAKALIDKNPKDLTPAEARALLFANKLFSTKGDRIEKNIYNMLLVSPDKLSDEQAKNLIIEDRVAVYKHIRGIQNAIKRFEKQGDQERADKAKTTLGKLHIRYPESIIKIGEALVSEEE